MFVKELGATAAQIPEIGLGSWGYAAGPEPLRRGLDAGACFIDTAESYGTEPVVAAAIAGRRDRVFLATKVSPQHFRRTDLLAALDGSLRRLRTDYIDLYQLHRPNGTVPLGETLGAMEEAVDAGKVRFIGVSNFSLAQLQQAQATMRRHPIVSNQVRYNLIDRAIGDDLLPYCQSHRVTVIAYSPLARGFQHIADCDRDGVLTRLAGATGRTAVQVALNWCVAQPGVVAIPKGTRSNMSSRPAARPAGAWIRSSFTNSGSPLSSAADPASKRSPANTFPRLQNGRPAPAAVRPPLPPAADQLTAAPIDYSSENAHRL